MADKKRFKEVYSQGVMLTNKIIVDTQTGVNYLFVTDGTSGGLTPLLDKDGKPVITIITDEK